MKVVIKYADIIVKRNLVHPRKCTIWDDALSTDTFNQCRFYAGAPLQRWTNIRPAVVQCVVFCWGSGHNILAIRDSRHLVTFITNTVNKSINTGTFPSSFKRALVSTLIKKSTHAQILRKYRPVSNLPFISKILEKVIAKQLTDHMKVHAWYEKHQSAYRC